MLRVLKTRGVHVPDDVRERVLACTDTNRLELWLDRAVTASTTEDVVGN